MEKTKPIKKLPVAEKIWLRHVTEKGNVFFVTSPGTREKYSLYLKVKDGYLLLEKAKTPIFDDIIAKTDKKKIT